jgi:C-terminal processing protease CtpA/Prc
MHPHLFGLRPGDLVTSVDDRPVRRGMDFDFALVGKRPGDTVVLDVARDGRPIETRLVLAERPAPDGAELARRGWAQAPLPGSGRSSTCRRAPACWSSR